MTSVAGVTHSGTPATHLVEVLGVSHPRAISGSRQERIAQLAAWQRGRVAHGQLLALGIPRRAIYRRLERGHLHRRHRGVYTVGHTAAIPLGPETDALLACGRGAVLSHTSAALLWEISPRNDGLIHVTIPHRHGARPPGVSVHRTSTLRQNDVRLRQNLPVTSPARTLADLADVLDDRDLDRAIDEALVQRLVTTPEVARAAAGARGRRAAGRLKRALARHHLPQVTRSEAERRLLELIRAAGLPEPEVNARIAGFEVDFLWRRQRLVVEVDGYKFHSSRPAFERDRTKGNRLVAAGLGLMRITWWQLEREPFAVIARLAEALVGTASAA